MSEGSWTTERLAAAIKRDARLETVPSPVIPPPVGLVQRLRRPLGDLRRAVRKYMEPLPGQKPFPDNALVLIDIQALQGPSAGRGIGRYTLNLILALVRVRPKWRIVLIANSALPPAQGELPPELPVSHFTPPAPDDIWSEGNERAYATWLLEQRADAILLTDLLTPPVVVPTMLTGMPPVWAILYDLIPLLFPEHYLVSPIYLPYYMRRLRAMLLCRGVLAISRSSADDFMRLFGPDCSPATSISGAVDGRFHPHPPETLDGWKRTLRERFGIVGEYLLYVGGPDHRKNLKGAIRAFAGIAPALRQAHSLVIACELPPEIREDLNVLARALDVADRTIIAGRVTDDELVALYQLCRLFVFPSLYEGLGLPILEAMSCGSPVVCGDNSSMSEFAGALAYQADAGNPQAFSKAIESALAEPRDLRNADRRAFAASFSWADTAEATALNLESRAPAASTRSSNGIAPRPTSAPLVDLRSISPAPVHFHPLQHYPGFTENEVAIFSRFTVEAPVPEPGFLVDFLGGRTRATSLADCQREYSGTVLPVPVPGDYHAEAIEYIGLLKSVSAARGQFVALELGAGWGPWLVSGGLAARRMGIAEIRLAGVEADPQHYEFLRQHLADNGFDPNAHKLFKAAVGIAAGHAKWPKIADAANDWGSRLAKPDGVSNIEETIDVEIVDIADILALEPLWDLVHIDVQGWEMSICTRAAESMKKRVRYAIVGTHSRKLDGDLYDLFHREGWILENEKPTQMKYNRATAELEDMNRADGTQVWRNPAL